MKTYIMEYIRGKVAEGEAVAIRFQKEPVVNAGLTVNHMTVGKDPVLSLIRVSGLTPNEQKEAKRVFKEELKKLRA